MQAKIQRTPNGHYLLHCALEQPDGWTMPESWTHIELELDSLRILCALPDHPRPHEFTLADPRLSSWLRAKAHSGKLCADQIVHLNDVFEGIYRVEAQHAEARSPEVSNLEAQAVETERMEAQDGVSPVPPIRPVRKAAAEAPKVRAIRPAMPRLLPRPVRREARPAAVVAPAS